MLFVFLTSPMLTLCWLSSTSHRIYRLTFREIFGENSVGRKFRRRKFHSEKFPFGKNSVRRKFLSEKKKVRRKILRRKYIRRKFLAQYHTLIGENCSMLYTIFHELRALYKLGYIRYILFNAQI